MQNLIVLCIVAGAALYLGRRIWSAVADARRARSGEAGCGSGCGCGDPGGQAPAARRMRDVG